MGNRRLGLDSAALLALLLAVGCGGAQPKQVGADNSFESTLPGVAASNSERASSATDKSEKDALTADQKAQLEVALRRGGDKAANCATVVPNAPHGEAEVTVKFDGKRGRAVDVQVGAPFAGTPVEACIKRSFVGEIVMPFDGELEVPFPVKIGAKGASAKEKQK